MAFTQNMAATFARQPRHGLAQIANADASGQKTVVTAGASGSKVTALYASSTDTSARVIAISIVRSATTYLLASPTVVLRAGDPGGRLAQQHGVPDWAPFDRQRRAEIPVPGERRHAGGERADHRDRGEDRLRPRRLQRFLTRLRPDSAFTRGSRAREDGRERPKGRAMGYGGQVRLSWRTRIKRQADLSAETE